MTANIALLYDHRDQPRGIHALIVGVGGYSRLAQARSPHQPVEPPLFNLKQLQSACPSAIRLAKLLESLHSQKGLRLGSCRLLATPIRGGRGAGFCEEHKVPRARLDLLIEAAQGWREDATNDPDGLLLFYFAGHGLQRDLRVTRGIEESTRRTEQLALLEDFGIPSEPNLHHTFSTEDLVGACFRTPTDKLTKQQIFIFDCCRNQPASIVKLVKSGPSVLLDEPDRVTEQDDRSLMLIHSTLPGYEAYGRTDHGSFLVGALIQALKGGAARERIGSLASDGRWVVQSSTLPVILEYYCQRLARRLQQEQHVHCDLRPPRSLVLRKLDRPPRVRFRVGVMPPRESQYRPTVVLMDLAVPDAPPSLQERIGADLTGTVWLSHRAGTYMFAAQADASDPEYLDALPVCSGLWTPFPDDKDTPLYMSLLRR
jgi:hypothetical protein